MSQSASSADESAGSTRPPGKPATPPVSRRCATSASTSIPSSLNTEPSRSLTPTRRAVLGREELGRVAAFIAQPLHDDSLAGQGARQPGAGGVLRVAVELAQAELEAVPRGLGPAADAALAGGLPVTHAIALR